MELAHYIPLLVQLLIAFGIATGGILLSQLLGQRAMGNPIKNRPYECGLTTQDKVHPRFSVQFHVVAALFILFDVEMAFLIPWVLVYREFLAANLPILLPGFIFLGLMAIGMLYELRQKGLDWER